MFKAFREIGIKRALKFAFFSPVLILFDFLPYPPLRVFFLRLFGAQIGKNTVIGQVKFVNAYRTGFKGLKIGSYSVLDDFIILDLANPLILEEHVTIAWGTIIITHRNVGYKEHPLQKHFPPSNGAVTIRRGSFIGAHCTILDGVTIGEEVCVAANSLVNHSIEDRSLAGGVPAKILKKLNEN